MESLFFIRIAILAFLFFFLVASLLFLNYLDYRADKK